MCEILGLAGRFKFGRATSPKGKLGIKLLRSAIVLSRNVLCSTSYSINELTGYIVKQWTSFCWNLIR